MLFSLLNFYSTAEPISDPLTSSLMYLSERDGPEACLIAEPGASLGNIQEEAMGGIRSGKEVMTNDEFGPSTAEQKEASARAAGPTSELDGQAFSAAAPDTVPSNHLQSAWSVITTSYTILTLYCRLNCQQ